MEDGTERSGESPRYCRSRRVTMYTGRPFQTYTFRCENKGETYGMVWTPIHCPICGGRMLVTEEEVCNG